MAIGLVPHYSVVFPIEGLTGAEFLVIIREVAKKLEWEVPHSDLNGLVAYTKFRRRSINEKIQLSVEEGLVTLKSETQGGQIFDMGRNKRNVNAFISCYDETRSSFSAEELKIKADQITSLQEQNAANPEAGLQSSLAVGEQSKGMLSMFIPVKGYFVTPILIDLNIVLFLLMVISGVNIMQPDNESLLHWGANFRPITLAGEPWRLVTNIFLHIGILHLLFNMYALLYIGILLERRLGSRRFGITYLISGIVASVASLYWHELTISAGASGAIFGMYGVFLAMLSTNLIEKSIRKALFTSIAVFVGFNLMNGMKGGIDGAAHIGGLVAGIIMGYSFYPSLSNGENKKLNFGLPALLAVGFLGLSFWTYRKIPTDIIQYDKKMQEFATIESRALRIYDKDFRSSLSTKQEFLSEIKDTSLFYWQKGENLITNLNKLELPKEVHQRNEKLMAYCNLRINVFQLLYKSIEDSTKEYNDQITAYNYSIDSLLKTLK